MAQVSSKAHTSRQRVLGIRTDENVQFVFIDTPGLVLNRPRSIVQRTMQGETQQAGCEADVLVLVLDA